MTPYTKFRIKQFLVRARRVASRNISPQSDRLHLGCGRRRIEGWLNVDLEKSDYDIDLTHLPLPWRDASFKEVVSQQVIEHLELKTHLVPLLKELHRVTTTSGRLWLSCPDIRKVCEGYLSDRGQALLAGRLRRFPDWSLNGIPSQHIINDFFHQGGEHKNLFDFELLTWTLNQCGFKCVVESSEIELMREFPEFPLRDDDDASLYVIASKR